MSTRVVTLHVDPAATTGTDIDIDFEKFRSEANAADLASRPATSTSKKTKKTETSKSAETSTPAFVKDEPATKLVQPARADFERGEEDGEISRFDKAAYDNWRKTGEITEDLFKKPADTKPAARETAEPSGESTGRTFDEWQPPNGDIMDSVADHLARLTPESHPQRVAALNNIGQQLRSSPDGKEILEAAGKIDLGPIKFRHFLTHNLADLPNPTGVFRHLVTHPNIVKHMQTQSPQAAIGVLHQVSAHVAAEAKWPVTVNAARKTYKDFNEVALKADLPIRKESPVDNFLLYSPHGADVLYHLGKNVNVLRRINRLMPVAQYQELSRIEASLVASRAPSRANRVSNAPPPVRTVGAASSAGRDAVESALKDDDVAGYMRAQNARDVAGRRRS